MERRKKYTHITARVNKISKLVSKCKLKDLCNYTLSEAYWRLDEGKGLLHNYDQESFNIWSDLMNQIAKMTSPAPLFKQQHEQLCSHRNYIWNKMEEYRTWIDKGTYPTQLQTYAYERNILMPFVQFAIELLVTNERDILSLDINEILEFAQKHQEKYVRDTDERIERGEIKEFRYPEELRTSTYQIRTDYSHKQSNSELIRSRIDGIWDLSPKTDETHRSIYSANHNVIKEYESWKNLKIKHDLNDLLNFFQRIQIPPMSEI